MEMFDMVLKRAHMETEVGGIIADLSHLQLSAAKHLLGFPPDIVDDGAPVEDFDFNLVVQIRLDGAGVEARLREYESPDG